MELKSATAIITGSSGKLGPVIAENLAMAGCNCICHYYRNRQNAEELVSLLKDIGVKAAAIPADLTNPDDLEKMLDKASAFGTPSILINAAALFSKQPIEKVSFEDAAKITALNQLAPIMASKYFAAQIRAASKSKKGVVGKIINIADIGGIRPWADYSVYCASKAGLIGATKALAKELAPRICVNAVAPGIITRDEISGDRDVNRQLSFIPLDRFGSPKEVAETVIFLITNDYITGQVLNVDGGRCI